MSDTRTFVQWKGTSLCMDLNCECGHHSHIDGYFAYHVMCPNCGAVYKMPENLPLERVDRDALDDGALIHLDTSEPIARRVGDSIVEVGSMGGDDIGQRWEKLKSIVPYAQAVSAEHDV